MYERGEAHVPTPERNRITARHTAEEETVRAVDVAQVLQDVGPDLVTEHHSANAGTRRRPAAGVTQHGIGHAIAVHIARGHGVTEIGAGLEERMRLERWWSFEILGLPWRERTQTWGPMMEKPVPWTSCWERSIPV